MGMQMKYGLTSTRVRIEHNSISALVNSFTARDFRGEQKHPTQRVRFARRIQRINMLSWNHQYVDRRLRIDVPKRDAMLVLGDNRR